MSCRLLESRSTATTVSKPWFSDSSYSVHSPYCTLHTTRRSGQINEPTKPVRLLRRERLRKFKGSSSGVFFLGTFRRPKIFNFSYHYRCCTLALAPTTAAPLNHRENSSIYLLLHVLLLRPILARVSSWIYRSSLRSVPLWSRNAF